MFSAARLKDSLIEAKRGLVHTFKNEQNFRIHVLVAMVAIIGALYFPLKNWERVIMKEIMAAGVLLVSAGAAIVGIIIFVPYIIDFIDILL